MKALIWILTFLIGTTLNVLLGYATGVRAGAVLLYLLEYYIAKNLCEKWDNRVKNKTANFTERGISIEEKQPINEIQTQNYIQLPETNNQSEISTSNVDNAEPEGYYFENIFEFTAFIKEHEGRNIVWKNGDNYISEYKKGYQLFEQGKYIEAIKVYEHCLELIYTWTIIIIMGHLV